MRSGSTNNYCGPASFFRVRMYELGRDSSFSTPVYIDFLSLFLCIVGIARMGSVLDVGIGSHEQSRLYCPVDIPIRTAVRHNMPNLEAVAATQSWWIE